MDKNTTLVAAWYGSAVTTLLFSLLFLIYLSTPKIMQPQIQTFKLYTALPKDDIEVSSSIGLKDARAKIIEDFFITVADKYKLDYRLLPAIAMQESNGGKKIITDSFNPFGYGIYGKLVTRFGTWEEGIERVGRALREDYLDAGLKNPVQIMAKYTPPSLAIGGTWAKGVNSFMEDLR